MFFNEKVLAIKFEIFEQLIVLKKVNIIIDKNWSKIIKLHKIIQEK